MAAKNKKRSSTNSRYKKNKKKVYSKIKSSKQKSSSKKRRRLKKWVIPVLFSIIIIIVVVSKHSISSTKEIDIKQKLDSEYELCVEEEVNNIDYEMLETEFVELNKYFSDNYSASIYYEEIDRGFKYNYNIDKSYYAASTIKTLDAIYLYDKAILGEINLDDTVTYTSNYYRSWSDGMKNHKFGDKIPLRTLVKYAITVSDNTAHEMLVGYIGKQNLKDYGKSLGASLTLNGGDNFGYINTTDASSYLKKLNTLFADKTYGEELKSYFINSDLNYLSLIENNVVAHKYGSYESVYHDISIVYAKRPYYLVILTNNGNKNHEEMIKEIGIKINELHNLFHENRKNYCDEKIYGI